MTLTIWQWMEAMWHELWPFWIAGILCWLAVLADWIDRKYVAKQKTVHKTVKIPVRVQIAVQYEETPDEDHQLIVSTNKSLGSLQPIC